MILRELHVRALPGIDAPFSLRGLGEGINVLIGPNASGKSSVVRALRALLYREEARGEAVHLEAILQDGEARLRVARVGDSIAWERDGRRIDRPDLPEHHRLGAYLVRLEDLVRRTELDGAIGDRIATELAGGFDLAAVRAGLDAPAGRKERGRLDAASTALREAEARRDALHARRARLQDLERERDEARDRAARRPAIEAARKLAIARRRRRGIDERLSAFPPGMAALRGDEADRAARAAGALRDARAEVRGAEEALREARDAFAAAGLEADAPSLAEVRERQAEATALAEAEREAREARVEAEDALARLASLLEGAGEDAAATPELRPETIRALGRAAAERDAAAADEARAWADLERIRHEAEAPEDPEPLDLPRQLLAAWLASPDPEALRPRGRGAGALHALALLLAGGAAWTAVADPAALAAPLPAALLAAAVAATVVALVLARPRPPVGAEGRAEAEAAWAACEVDPPRSWTPPAVRARYEELTRRYAAVEATREREAARRARERELEAEARRAEAAHGRAREALAVACAEAGLPVHAAGEGVLARLDLAADVREARATLAARRAALERREREAAALREGVLRTLVRTGDAPAEGEASATRLRMRLDALAHRLGAREAARDRIAAAEAALARARRDVEDAAARRAEPYRACGIELPDDADDAARAEAEARLRDRVRRLDAWRGLRQERDRLEGEARGHEADLAARPDLLALARAEDEARLEEERERAVAAEEEKDRLQRRITEIETEVRAAEHDRRVEEARAEATRARDALEGVLEEALAAEAGRFLLDRVEEEGRATHRPAALERASAWFGRFTRHAFSLEFDPARPPAERLFARDRAADRELALDRLSTGTKAQLLLAVRVAHAVEAERGRTALPLVLDEALTTTDADRFVLVAEALHLLAREEGRQVFYLSARRSDAELWTAPEGGAPVRTIDVAEARGRAWSAPAADAYRPEPRPRVPAPAGMGADAYAAALGVPPVDPWAPDAVHPFHVLRDDLELVARLATLRVTALGPLRGLLEDAGRPLELPDDARRRLRARIAGAGAWCRAWRVGRGRRVDATVLREHVSGTFRREIAALAEEAGGDATTLLERLRENGVSGFGPKRTDALEEALVEAGCLDPRPPAGEEALVVEVARALRAVRGEAAPEEAARVASWLAAGVRVGRATPAAEPAD